jgi:hypothetical protein
MKRSSTRWLVAAITLTSAAAVVGAGLAGPAGAATPSAPHTGRLATAALTNIGVSQTAAVNSAQTSYPVSLHWSNTGGAAFTYIYRYDDSAGTYTYIGEAGGSVAQWYDVLTMNGNSAASGDYYQYDLSSYDSGGNYLSDDWSYEFSPIALDDASGQVSFSHGTWYRKNQTGATKNHYTYSSSTGATASAYLCYYNVGLVGTTGPTGGTANIVENGVIVKKVNFKSSTTKKRVLLWKAGFPSYQCNTISVVRTTGQINVDTIQAFSA